MHDTLYSIPLDQSIAYFAKHGFAMFPCTAGSKIPACAWTRESSHDPAQWQAWRAAGFNLAINAARSNLIILDVDASKIGREAAWLAYHKQCMSWGLPALLAPTCESARGGWHTYVRRPDGVDPAALRGTRILVHDDAGHELIGVKVRGYAVAPGSVFVTDTGARLPYSLLSDAPAPHTCPPALIETLQLPKISAPTGKAGEADCADVAGLVAFLDEQGEFASEPEWFKALGAIKLALGDTDDGLAVAEQITTSTPEEFRKKWERLSCVPRPHDFKIGSLIWRAEQIGRKFHVRKSTDATFGDVAASLPVIPSPPTAPAGATPLIGGAAREPLPDGPTDAQAAELADFVAYLPAHSYIFVPTRELWPATSVNARIPPIAIAGRDKPIAANAWLDTNRSVEQMSWAPGMPMEIRDRLIADGGWIDHPGATTFNLYRPPAIRRKPGDASPWVDHVRRLFGDESDHIAKWLAQRVQRPHEKINHALVLGGMQGVGKDTILEPVKASVGPWNFIEVGPHQMLGAFNSFAKSVILRVSEAHDLGDVDRFGFYERLKTYTASPPDVLRVNEKHLREYAVLNVCGVVITSNHKTDGLYLPADDRRHFVAWSSLTKDDFSPAYWNGLYGWFASGGNEMVAHYLATLDIAGFDAKAPPPKTRAFWDVVDASRAPEDAEMAEALDALGRPNAVTIEAILSKAAPDFRDWLRDRKNRQKVGYRLEESGYVRISNRDATSGLWVIGGRRQAVYAKRDLSPRDQMAHAAALTRVPVPGLPILPQGV